jgi:hypothetical protein
MSQTASSAPIAPGQVRAAVASIIGIDVRGVVKALSETPGLYYIPLPPEAACSLIGGDPGIAPGLFCVHDEGDWAIALGDETMLEYELPFQADVTKADWRTSVDEELLSGVVDLVGNLFADVLEGTEVRPKASMHEYERDVYRHTLGTVAGDLRYHTRRVSTTPSILEFAIETSASTYFVGRICEQRLDLGEIRKVDACPF